MAFFGRSTVAMAKCSAGTEQSERRAAEFPLLPGPGTICNSLGLCWVSPIQSWRFICRSWAWSRRRGSELEGMKRIMIMAACQFFHHSLISQAYASDWFSTWFAQLLPQSQAARARLHAIGQHISMSFAPCSCRLCGCGMLCSCGRRSFRFSLELLHQNQCSRSATRTEYLNAFPRLCHYQLNSKSLHQ